MSKDLVNVPTARSWRDIPQPVKSRAMSASGRWRRMAHYVRIGATVALALGLGWGAWKVAAALGENPTKMPAAARAVPMGAPKLRTDGVLDDAWLAATLALPKDTSLMELDLVALRERLLGDGQIINANLTRRFPASLEVQVFERMPVARIMADVAGERRRLLVARDGVVFAGAGYLDDTIAALPWLDGVALGRVGGRFLPVEGMDVAADLLAKAHLEADHLARTWGVISLARLDSDREIEVRTREPYQVTVVFAANPSEDRLSRDLRFLQQLGKLDYLWETLVTKPGLRVRVDLSLGRQVPVMVDEPTPAAVPVGAPPTASGAATPAFRISLLSSVQPRNKS